MYEGYILQDHNQLLDQYAHLSQAKYASVSLEEKGLGDEEQIILYLFNRKPRITCVAFHS